jgi:hypothetical protein
LSAARDCDARKSLCRNHDTIKLNHVAGNLRRDTAYGGLSAVKLESVDSVESVASASETRQPVSTEELTIPPKRERP